MIDICREIALLNPKQREAVEHSEGPLLILAGAGSGKTRVITMRTAYLIYTGVRAGSVLAVTFTNKAAKEMKERVHSMVKGKNGTPVVSTFHSLCLKILRREIEHLGYRKDFTIYDTSEQVSLLRNILSDIKFYDRSFKAETILERISRTKNDFTPPDNISSDDPVEEVSAMLYPRYSEALKSLNALDFDDLLLLTLKVFREYPVVVEKYSEGFRYIMVDEYQDTNRIQYDFIKLLAGERKNLCVVGDDDQSIYGWRSADLGNILDFEKDFPGTVTVRLEQNYRSFGHILILPHKKSADRDEDIEEERRLFYVGITRAMNELYITYTDRRSKYGKEKPSVPSRFLNEIPEEVIKRLDRFEKLDPEQEKVYAKKFFANIKAILED